MVLKKITQNAAFGEELKRLNEEITKADRHKAMNHFDIKSKATLSQYLNGNVRNLDLAAELILFFKDQIHRRNLVLLDSLSTQTA